SGAPRRGPESKGSRSASRATGPTVDRTASAAAPQTSGRSRSGAGAGSGAGRVGFEAGGFQPLGELGAARLDLGQHPAEVDLEVRQPPVAVVVSLPAHPVGGTL